MKKAPKIDSLGQLDGELDEAEKDEFLRGGGEVEGVGVQEGGKGIHPIPVVNNQWHELTNINGSAWMYEWMHG